MKKKNQIKKIILFCLLFIFVCPLIFITGCKENINKLSENLTNYNLNLTFNDDNKLLVGKETVDYKNTTNTTLNNLCFHLYPNAFRKDAKYKPVSTTNYEKAYPNGFSEGNIEIKKVLVNNNEQNIKITGNDANILQVDFNEDLYPDERIVINIEFDVKLPNCLHRFGYGDNTLNFGNFYPIVCKYENGSFKQDNYGANGDPFYSDMANYNVDLTYNNKFTLASSGVQNKTTQKDNIKSTNITANVVRDFGFVLSDKFEVISDKYKDTTIYYYYYEDDNPKQSLKAGIDSIKTFSNIFGEYPYKTYSVVKSNFIHGGMEYPNLVYISDSVADRDEYLNVIVHETAHQWWYNMVGSNACEYAWLDEGLTEFSTLMFYRYNEGYNINEEKSLNSSLSSYLLFSEICESVYGKFDSTMTKNVNDFKGEMDYVYITYVKGVLFFDNLEDLVGKKNFLKSLKLYFKQNQYGIATPDDLIYSFESVCKCNLENFFDSWINGKVILQNNK